jgi:tetratricopeptide (TPR) repeat protein
MLDSPFMPTTKKSLLKISSRMRTLGMLCIIYVFRLYFSISLYSQNVAKKVYLPKDTAIQKQLDDSVDYYETSGISFFHIRKYDTAIKNFNQALYFLDLLSDRRKDLTDYTTIFVTKCNISICYCKEKKFYQGYRNVPWEFGTDPNRISYLTQVPSDQYDLLYTYMLAFLQCTDGDCERAMKQYKMALSDYSIASENLYGVKCRDSLITYKYALKAYLYSPIYRAILGSYMRQDTSNGSSYLKRIPRISQDK